MSNVLLRLAEHDQECREYRHPWAAHNVIEHGTKLEEVQVCPRCGNERFRVLGSGKRNYGHIIRGWQIRYTNKNYLLKKGQERPTLDDWGEMRMQLLGYGR